MARLPAPIAPLLCLALLAACSKPAADNTASANVATPAPPPVTAPPPPPPVVGPHGFIPLQSQAVKDAIHMALSTGQTQRWSNGDLAGYAVPSTTTDAHGCRTVRYTIDQQPDAPAQTITACDAGR
jgi:hypothetical protein